MTESPIILFGAFDRHNLGDLLLAQVAAMDFGNRPVIFAGLAERDMRPWGGPAVQSLSDVAKAWGTQPADLCHVGGEILACTLYEAAVMLLPPAEVAGIITRYDQDQKGRQTWAQEQLGLLQQMAYLAPTNLFSNPRHFSYRAIGGVNINDLPQAMQREIQARMRDANDISVRDSVTQGHLAAWGIQARLEEDPATRVAELFGSIIAHHGAIGGPAAIRQAFPQGYLAIQLSADFGDDATLLSLAGQLDHVIHDTGLGCCLFRAGAAPWHDDNAVYQRCTAFMKSPRVRLFDSLNLWDMCALLAHAKGYCGSSLHGRIVAHTFGVPAISLIHPGLSTLSKAGAYAATWWPGTAWEATPDRVHATLMSALERRPTSLIPRH